MELDLFGRTKPDAHAREIDWDAVSGLDLATDDALLRRFIREELPRQQAQMQRWARTIRARKREQWRQERALTETAQVGITPA